MPTLSTPSCAKSHKKEKEDLLSGKILEFLSLQRSQGIAMTEFFPSTLALSIKNHPEKTSTGYLSSNLGLHPCQLNMFLKMFQTLAAKSH